jgi:hypothetical protein
LRAKKSYVFNISELSIVKNCWEKQLYTVFVEKIQKGNFSYYWKNQWNSQRSFFLWFLFTHPPLRTPALPYGFLAILTISTIWNNNFLEIFFGHKSDFWLFCGFSRVVFYNKKLLVAISGCFCFYSGNDCCPQLSSILESIRQNTT